jgi:hypothetical protein
MLPIEVFFGVGRERRADIRALLRVLFLVSTFMLAALYRVKETPSETRPALELDDGQGSKKRPQPSEYKGAVADVTNW